MLNQYPHILLPCFRCAIKLVHVQNFLHSTQVSGIGNVMEQHLQALTISQCGHLMEKRGLLRLLFTETNYYNFLTIALGLGHSTLSAWTERDRKSISTETTFKGTSDRPTLFKLSANLCQELADEMQQKDIVGKVLTLKLKTTDFQLRTRAQTLSEVTCCPEVMTAGIKRLLLYEMNAATEQPLSLRLLGVRMSSLVLSSEVGQRRQATLTQMFSQAAQPKAATSTTLSHCELESHQSQRGTVMESVTTKSNIESNATVKVEKINHSQKKSPLIENYLLKSKSAKPEEESTRIDMYECSVCEKQIVVESLEEFNKHLDTCLEVHSSPPLQNPNTDNSNFCKINTSIQKNSGFVLSADCEDNEIQSDISHANICESSLGSTSSLKQNLLCPVCEQRSYSDMTTLNKHMDECLNKSAISELLQESNQQHEAARSLETDISKNRISKKRRGNAESHIHKKTKNRINTLDKYFCS